MQISGGNSVINQSGIHCSQVQIQGVFLTGTPPKSPKKLIWARLGVSRADLRQRRFT